MPILSDFSKRKSELAKEHERRWVLNSLPSGASKPSQIKQGMIAEIDGEAYVRIREQDGKYSMTGKYFPLHHEAETDISKEMFEALWPTVKKPQVKTRYQYKSTDDHEWVIDEMEDGKIVAECETDRKNAKIEVPEEFDVKEEMIYD